MSSLRLALLLVFVVPATSVQSQSVTTRPTTAKAGTVVVNGADLVIDSIDLMAPRILGSSATADGDQVHASGVYVTARVTNRGRERWASRGEVGFSLSAGQEEMRADRLAVHQALGHPKCQGRPVFCET